MRILNLGCGMKVSSHPDIINVDWSVYLKLKRNRLTRRLANIALNGDRLARFNSLPDNILVHDLSKGIPAEDESVDGVYHSHLFEHLDRDVAARFLKETHRVLKPNGIVRIVVPDLEYACRNMLEHIHQCETEEREQARHDEYVAEIIEQCVRREAAGTSRQRPLRRKLENLLLGDARRRGETHQWMYDKINLSNKLRRAGFSSTQVCSYRDSQLLDWNTYGLDVTESGSEYKPGSLYMEARK